MRVSTVALAVFSTFFISSRIAAAFCFASAGDAYRIDPLLLQAIATVESGLRPDAVHHNTNGTRDIGLMQINSVHLPHLRSRGIDQQQLLQDPCLSVMVGAEILARFISRHGYGWQAVGAYNAGSASGRALARQRYIARVWSRYVLLLDRKPYRRPNAYSPDATPSSATKAQIPRPAGITQKTLEYAPCRRDNSTSNTHGVGKSGMFRQRSAAMT
jgi:soluble lytic murein transglycosylase-like protein